MKLNNFKKEIIEFFLKHPSLKEEVFQVSYNEFNDQFEDKPEYKQNLATLIEYGIINSSKKNDEFILSFFKKDHQIEVQKILNFELLEDQALKMQPSIDDTKNLQPIFLEHADQNRSNGVYYFYSDKNNPECWIVLARLNAKKNPYRYNLGSIKDSNSKLHQMWLATVQAWKANGKQAIRRSMAEKINQDAFGNNRQPGFAAFKLFLHAGWLKITSGTQTAIFYNIIDEKIHLDSKNLNEFTENILKGWGFYD